MTTNTSCRQNSDDATVTEKRVKIGSGPSMKESDSCSEVDLVLSERRVLPPSADGNVGEPSEKINQSGGYTNGNPATFPKTRTIFSLYEQLPFLLDSTASNNSQI